MKLNVEFINPFLSATVKVLQIQANTLATASDAIKREGKNNKLCDISGVIAINADVFKGSVVIGFPKLTFLGVMGRMLGEEYHEINPEIMDGAGELTNMIFGQAKAELNQKGYGIKMAIPSVVSGSSDEIHGDTNLPIVVVPFETDLGAFYVEISLLV